MSRMFQPFWPFANYFHNILADADSNKTEGNADRRRDAREVAKAPRKIASIWNTAEAREVYKIKNLYVQLRAETASVFNLKLSAIERGVNI